MPKAPWEQKGITTEEYFKTTAPTLYRGMLSIKQGDSTFLKENYLAVVQELSKVVEASGHFLMVKESGKLTAMMYALRNEVERLKRNDTSSTDRERVSPSSEN